MGFIKAVLLFIALVSIGGFCMVLALLMWGSTRLNRIFLQLFARATRAIVGIRQIVIHEEHLYSHRPAILVGNHQTGLDLSIIGSVCPTGSVIVAKKELKYIPLFGWFFMAAGNLMINRSKSEDAKKMMKRITDSLISRKLNLVIFPEGTRNRNPTEAEPFLPFKKGAFFMAINAQMPIVPVVCSSLAGKAIWERFGELKGGVVVISALKPIETRGLTLHQVDSLRDEVREKMVAELKRVNALAAQYSLTPSNEDARIAPL